MTDRSKRPEVRELRDIKFPEIEERTLSNGIKVYAYDRKDLRVMRMSVITDGGSADAENPATASLASLLIQEGAGNMRGKEIADRLELCGAWTQSQSGIHERSVSVTALSEKWDRVLPIISEIVADPIFPEAEFGSLKSRLCAQSLTNEESVAWQSEVISNRITFGPKHPLAIACDHDMIERVSLEEVKSFHFKYLNPANMKIFITGDVTEGVMNGLEKEFGKLPNLGKKEGKRIVKICPSPAPLEELTEMPGKMQSAISATIPLLDLAPEDVLPLRLTIFALGGYFGSRLQQNIREEKGLTYGIGSQLLSFKEGRVMKIRTDCATEYVEQVLEEIGKELSQLRMCPMGEEELTRMRRAEINNLSEIVSTPFSIMSFQQAILINGYDKDYFAQRLKATLDVTAESIRELAEKYLSPERLLIAIAGGSE